MLEQEFPEVKLVWCGEMILIILYIIQVVLISAMFQGDFTHILSVLSVGM